MQDALTGWQERLGERLSGISGNAAVHLASLTINMLALALPIVLMQIYDRVIPNQNRATLVVLGLGLLGAVIAEVIMRGARSRLMTYAGARYEVETTLRLCRRFLQTDEREIQKTPPGEHVGRVTAIDRIRDYRSGDGATAALDLPFSIIFLVAVAWIATPIAVLLLALIAITIFIVRKLSQASEDLAAERATQEGRRYSFLIEVLSRIEPVKSAGINAFMERRYERLMKASAATTAAYTANSSVAQGVIGAVSQLTPVVVGALGAVLVSFNAMSIGALAAVILLSGRAIQPIMRVESMVAGDLNTRRLEEDIQQTLAAPVSERGTLDPGTIETVSLRNVACIRREDGSLLLEGINLDLKRGEIIGIRGPNGSGKSSIVGLMAGQIAAEQGEVLINNTPIEACSPRALADHTALLPDRPTLLDGTVLENMTRFHPQDRLDEAVELATALGMDEYFAAHPDGLSMKIRQGVNAGLPTSVIDRVALVAGLLGNPSLVLFDEANLSLDFEGDNLLREHLFARRQSAAVVLVAQRPSYLKGCDRLYRISDGKLLIDDGADLAFNRPSDPSHAQMAARA